MVSMGMATATNLDGPQSVVLVSPPLSGAPVASGPLSLLPNPTDTDSMVTIPMPMAFTTLMPTDIMSLMSLNLSSLHLPLLTSLLLLLVLEATPVAPLLILTEALKVFVAKDLLKKLPPLKMIKFTEPDTTAMLDKPSGDSPRSRGLPKK